MDSGQKTSTRSDKTEPSVTPRTGTYTKATPKTSTSSARSPRTSTNSARVPNNSTSSTKSEIPTVSKVVALPGFTNGDVSPKKKRVSLDASATSLNDVKEESTTNLHSQHHHHHHKSKVRRCRKRLSILLHTHVALILVCLLAALDATCVIGQIICDILIMKESLSDWQNLDTNLTSLLFKELPRLNASDLDPSDTDLAQIRDFLWASRGTNYTQLAAQTFGLQAAAGGIDPRWLQALQSAAASGDFSGAQASGSLNVTIPPPPLEADKNDSSLSHMIIGFFKIPVPHSRSKRAAGGDTAEHSLLHELTHAFHLGSMVILSMLLLETLLKVFAMGKKILHHKLEMFDVFVVTVSWSLDVAFWEGIWAHPGTEAATILIFILPWRVVRIVNSFVLVIQEKDHVQLKIVKQRLRLSMKKSKESTRKASSYRTEVKQLQGLCRKYGATENEINACGPTGRTGRRRSSLLPAMERAASLTLISALGSHPSLYTMDSSSDEEDANCRDLTRTVSQDPTLRSAFSVSTLDSVDVFTIDGKGQSMGEGQSEGYVTSDNEDGMSADGLDNPVFEGDDDVDKTGPLDASTPANARHHDADDAESGRALQAKRLHQLLTDQPSNFSVESETNSSGSGADPANQEIPPNYHEVISQQDSMTRL